MSATSEQIKYLQFNNIRTLTKAQIQEFLEIMESTTFDMSGCLRSCSNHGSCPIDTNARISMCVCDPYFSGKACQTDTRPCSQVPCINNGTCVKLHANKSSSDKLFQCECPSLFYGDFCEYKLDICKNVTCSSNGICISSGNEPRCECFIGYDGKNCENMDKFQKIRKSIQLSSVIILVVIVLAFVLLVIINDILSYFGIRRSGIRIRFRRIYMDNSYGEIHTPPLRENIVRFKYVNSSL